MTETTASEPETPPGDAATTPTAAPALPPAILALFGKPPLLVSEDADIYEALLSRIAIAVRPRDAFEWMLLKDYADLAWEIFRLRRAKAGVINLAHHRALTSVLLQLGWRYELAAKWHTDPEVKTSIRTGLEQHGLDEAVITAEAVAQCCDQLGTFDRMIASTELRRNAMLGEIEHRRAGLAGRLRKGSADYIDAEVEHVPAISPGARLGEANAA